MFRAWAVTVPATLVGVLLCGVPAASAAPPPLVIDAPAAGSVVVSTEGTFGLVLTGSGPGTAGTSILVTAPVSGDAYPLCLVPVEADGSWTCVIDVAPSTPGPLTVSNGMEFAEGDIAVLDVALLHPPTVETDAGSADTITPTMTVEDPTQEIRGTGEPFNLVAVRLNDGSGCDTTVGADGVWSCLLTALPTGSGPFTLVAAQAYPSAPDAWVTTGPFVFALEAPTIVVPGPGPGPGPVPGPQPVPGTDPAPVPGPGAGTTPDVGPVPDAGPEPADTAPAVASAGSDRGSPPGLASGGVGEGGGASERVSDGASARVLESSSAGVGAGRDLAGSGSARSGRGAEAPSSDAEDRTGDVDARELSAAGDRGGAGGGARVVPSGFSLALVTIGDALQRAPAGAAFLGILVLAAMLLVMVPGGVLEATVHENADRIRRSAPARAFHRLMPLRPRKHADLDRNGTGRGQLEWGHTGRGHTGQVGWGRSGWGLAAVLVVGAVASAMVSPQAGVDAATGGLVLAFLGAGVVMAVVGVGAALVTGRRFGVRGIPFGRPAALILTAMSVAASRAAGLDPGFVFGALIGVQFVALSATAGSGASGVEGRLGARGRARMAVVGSSASVALGMVAWVLQNALRPVVVERPDALGVLLLDVATAVTVGALSGPVVSLLPARFLDGSAVFAHSKRLWAVSWGGAALAFGFVLLPLPAAWSAVASDLVPWLVGFGAFALVTAAVWAYFRVVPDPSPAAEVPSTEAVVK